MTLNSSKQTTPSPFRSNLRIMARHSSMPCSDPSLPSIRIRLAGVMQPSPFTSYIANASLSPLHRSSSASVSGRASSLRNSSSFSSRSPSASADATSASASSTETSSPSAAFMHCRSSAAEILPSASRSKEANTLLKRSAVAACTIFACLI
uniref:Uncharacterized protein n=1 Tax=Triticum urartu TaxID=4572 RepID=A0A8R7PXQ6_TRIUA